MRSRIIVGVLLAALVLSMLPLAAVATSEPTSPVWGVDALDTSSIDLFEPDLYGGLGVWVDTNGYISSYDWTTDTLQTFYSGGDAYDSVISDQYVVWTDAANDPVGLDIWAKDLTGGAAFAVAEGAGQQRWPSVYGDRTVYHVDGAGGGSDIELADLSAGTTLSVTSDAYDQGGAVIESQTVVWWDERGSDRDIYMKDLSTGIESVVCAEAGDQEYPDISGDIIVWEDHRGGDDDIYMKDLSTGIVSVVCDAAGDQEYPDIFGDLIVWSDNRSGVDYDIYAYDLSTNTEWLVTDAAGDQECPVTDGDLIFWQDGSGTYTSIWGAGFDTTAPTTTSDLKKSYTGYATITLSAEDNLLGSGIQKTWYKVDYVGDYYDGPFTVDRPGKHTLHYKSYDNVDNLEAYNVEYFDVISTNTTYTALEGPTRYDTAVVSSQKAFPKGSSCVVIATGVNWPDALGGAALAKKKNGPILLTHPNAMASSVIDEIERLDPSSAYILGGEAVVSADVEDELKTLLGEEAVTRIGGDNRYETANLVAKEVVGDGSSYKVFVATGKNFPDALGASPLATLGPWPIVLAPEGKELPASTLATIDEIGAKYGVLLGGEAAVAPAVEEQLLEKFGEGKVERLSGDTRYDTAIECAEFGIAHGLMWDGLAISTGANFPDALAGGILQGQADSVLLLTPSNSLHPSVAAVLQEQRDWIGNVTYLGGTAAVSQEVRDEVESILKPALD